jgi:hypothetical protein
MMLERDASGSKLLFSAEFARRRVLAELGRSQFHNSPLSNAQRHMNTMRRLWHRCRVSPGVNEMIVLPVIDNAVLKAVLALYL